MNDTYIALTVVFDRDASEEHAERIADAIRLMHGVLSVAPHVADHTSWAVEERVRHDLGTRLLAVVYPTREAGRRG